MTVPPETIYRLCDTAQEELAAYLADPSALPQEKTAAHACQVIVDGLRTISPLEDLTPRWNAVLFTLEALHRSDTVGRAAAHVYRYTYRALTGRPTGREA